MPFVNQTIHAGPYTANGSANVFPFNFLALSKEEVRVFVVTAQGVETTISGYEVQGIGRSQGGSVVFPNAPNYPGQLLYIEANPKWSQETDFENQDAYNPSDMNRALDRAAMRDLYLLTRTNIIYGAIDRINAELGLGNTGGNGGGQTGGGVNWSSIVGKPSSFPPAPHTHAMSDIVGLTDSFQATAERDLSNVSEQDFQLAAIRAGIGGGGGGGGAGVSLASFGALDGGGVNSAVNDAAFAAAEASAYSEIWIPDGLYRTTRHMGELTKHYVGRGRILPSVDGQPAVAAPEVLPANFSFMRVKPDLWPVQGRGGWFRGDQRFTDGGEWRVIGYGVREDVNARYFESAAIPHHAWMEVGSGHSGLTSRLAVPAQAGQNNVTLWAPATAFPVGKKFKFASAMDELTGQEYTITAPPNGNTITFAPALDQAYPAGAIVATGKRTWNGHTYVRVDALQSGGGDVYGHIVRLRQNYQPTPGQKHWVNTGTVGQYGGDVYFGPGSSGAYATGWESQYHDDGNDVSVAAQVDSFARQNDTGAGGAMWIGILLQSSGPKPIDAGYVMNGPVRTVLDTSGADLSSFMTPGDQAQCAINMAQGHRIYFNSRRLAGSRTADPNGHYYGPMFGSTLGDYYLGSGVDSVSEYIEMAFNRAAPNNGRFRLRPNGGFFNVPLKTTKYFAAGEDIIVGETSYATPGGTASLAFGASTGNGIRFNRVSNKFEFLKNYAVVFEI